MTRLQELLKGIEIIRKYEPNADVAVGDDSIYIGEYDPDKMTVEELEKMEELGFLEEEDSWMKFL